MIVDAGEYSRMNSFRTLERGRRRIPKRECIRFPLLQFDKGYVTIPCHWKLQKTNTCNRRNNVHPNLQSDNIFELNKYSKMRIVKCGKHT